MTVYDTNTAPRRDMTWAHWVTGIAGVLLFIAPWVLGYASTSGGYGGSNMAGYASWILGALIAIFSFIGLARGAGLWTMWVAGILGILAFIAPWVLGFTSVTSAAWACWVLGAISVIFAAIDIFVRPVQPVA